MLTPHLNDKRFVEHREYDVKQLWESHHEIVRLIVLGMNNKDIAEQLNITPQTVSNIRNSPLAREKVAELSGQRDEETVDISKRIQKFAPQALQVLEDVISGVCEDATITLKVHTAKSYLASAGYGPVQKVHSINEHLSRTDIEKIKERARNAAQSQGVIEVDYETINAK